MVLQRIILASLTILLATGSGMTMANTEATNAIGVVIMHGKGGMPTRFVNDLEATLANKGFLVANIEMPWSGRRDYDVDIATAEAQVQTALQNLRDKGAQKLFLAGHSQGGLFALVFAGRHKVDGVIAMAPGGYVDGPLTREKLGDSLAKAKQLVAAGKGAEKESFLDFEGAKGTYPIIVAPAIYVNWFDPEGAMTIETGIRRMSPDIPVLFIVPTNDHPGLLKAKQVLFNALPRHPNTRLYEPSADHLGAPSASRDEIDRWMKQISSH
jgi:pimeloyl-ACP methyl ester carboxylesterase